MVGRYRAEPGHEIPLADTVGLLSDHDALANDGRFQEALNRLEGDHRFTAEAIAARRAARDAAGVGTTTSTTTTTSSAVTTTSAEPVPDVISFGFCKLIFEFLQALKVRSVYK